MTPAELQLALADVATAPAAKAEPLSPDEMAARLRAQGYRVLAPVVHRPVIDEPRGEPERHGLVVDVETTGRDHASDAIIQLAAIPFRFTERTGRVTAVDEPVVAFNDPGRQIPEEVVALTGITDDNVRGTRLEDTADFAALAAAADLVIAHNARFDRPFVETRLPAFADCAWACTWSDVAWGPGSQTLEMLLLKHCEKCIDAHRADEDCLAVIELLAATLDDDDHRTVMARLLEAASRETCRVLAVGAPFESKDDLKRRGYRWHPGDASSPKCWWREIPADQKDDEREWLETNIYPQTYRVRAVNAPREGNDKLKDRGYRWDSPDNCWSREILAGRKDAERKWLEEKIYAQRRCEVEFHLMPCIAQFEELTARERYRAFSAG